MEDRSVRSNGKPEMASPGSGKVKCAIALDSFAEAMSDFFRAMLPVAWRPYSTVAVYHDLYDVIRMVRATLPVLLVIHTNLLFFGPGDWIANCAVVNPNMRYIFVAAWTQEETDYMQHIYEPLHVSLAILRLPFEREQFIAALEAGMN